MVKIRSAYEPNLKALSTLVCPEPTRTKQSEADSCDINKIVQRWVKSGCAVDLSTRVGQFTDCLNVPDYKACQDFILQAEQTFNLVPSNIRSRFNNDPAEFISFCTDEANRDELVSMGLAVAKPSLDDVGLPNSPSTASKEGSPQGDQSSSPKKGE